MTATVGTPAGAMKSALVEPNAICSRGRASPYWLVLSFEVQGAKQYLALVVVEIIAEHLLVLRHMDWTLLWRSPERAWEGGVPDGFQGRIVSLSLLQQAYPLGLVLLDGLDTLQVHLDILKLFAGDDVVRIHARGRGWRRDDVVARRARPRGGRDKQGIVAVCRAMY